MIYTQLRTYQDFSNGTVRGNDHPVCFKRIRILHAVQVSLPEDISQLEDGQSKFGAREGEGALTYSVPYSPWTFATVHLEGPVATYAVIKALFDDIKRIVWRML
jgi:hypothetical protein